MAKIDSVKEKINILRDDYRNLFILFMAIITGSFTIFYQVVILKILLVYSLFGLTGLVISIFILLKIMKLKYNIDILINELEKL